MLHLKIDIKKQWSYHNVVKLLYALPEESPLFPNIMPFIGAFL